LYLCFKPYGKLSGKSRTGIFFFRLLTWLLIVVIYYQIDNGNSGSTIVHWGRLCAVTFISWVIVVPVGLVYQFIVDGGFDLSVSKPGVRVRFNQFLSILVFLCYIGGVFVAALLGTIYYSQTYDYAIIITFVV